ncbi:RNA polymerase sigma factor [soil metagenome]
MDAPTAFRQQLLAAIPRLRRYARALVQNADLADDVVQTALERALSHWHQFDQRRDILVWLVSIAHNAYMDEYRRHSRLQAMDPQQAQDMLDSRQPESGFDMGLRIDLLAALQALPIDQREPLLLVTLEQLSYAQCAEILRVPIGTVMSRISRARSALRVLLDSGALPAESRTLRRVV